eukprot:490080_1
MMYINTLIIHLQKHQFYIGKQLNDSYQSKKLLEYWSNWTSFTSNKNHLHHTKKISRRHTSNKIKFSHVNKSYVLQLDSQNNSNEEEDKTDSKDSTKLVGCDICDLFFFWIRSSYIKQNQ